MLIMSLLYATLQAKCLKCTPPLKPQNSSTLKLKILKCKFKPFAQSLHNQLVAELRLELGLFTPSKVSAVKS